MLRSEIFSDYLNIPLDMLMHMITQHFPFIKDTDIGIVPCSDVITSGNSGNIEVSLHVYAGILELDRGRLNEIELKQIGKLLQELTQLYEDLDVDTTLYVRHVPIDEVRQDHFAVDDEDEHDFVELSF